jgi:predicted DNA-binding transcriptional regulator AlpA
MDEMLGLKAVITATGISRSTIYVLMGQGRLNDAFELYPKLR